MPDYERLYFQLAGQAADILDKLETTQDNLEKMRWSCSFAIDDLKAALLWCEEQYIEGEDEIHAPGNKR